MVLTTRFGPCGQNPDGLDEGHVQYVHGQIDCTAATHLGARVVPLDARRQYLKLTVIRSDMPATAVRVLHGMIGGVDLAEAREGAQRRLAPGLPKMN